MSSEDQIVLYDIPSVPPCKTWSLNPWKTRLFLNYKGLNYRTEWTEYPDIKPKLQDHVPPAKSPLGIEYSSPAITLPDGTWIMDSRAIANEIEKRHPTPSVHLDSPVLSKIEEIMTKIMPALVGIYVPLVPQRLLNEASHPHWYKTRPVWVGMPLDQLQRERGGQKAWDGAKPYIDEVTKMLKEDQSGPYFLGKEISYADFVWAGYLIFMQRIGQDVWEDLMRTAGADAEVHGKLLLGLDQWTARSDK
ncbi:hypothetical protein OHC33_000811 [Knufia fluminis]|uniref:GST N-terminal domain-containing protein n=1 Tax=Knufia fluminis TaxID=191047 RepID=A0AAN8EKA7_9EURO|nr:hypothetical protein OHC33_000811 [Knufia fluminis]